MSEPGSTMTSACAVFDCGTCSHMLRGRCPGCSEGNAEMRARSEPVCAIFECVTSRGIAACSECAEPSCPQTRSVEMVCPVRARFEKKRCYSRRIANHFSGRNPCAQEVGLVARKLDKVIGRLPWYLYAVEDFISQGAATVSSADIARKVGVKAWVVRRDLSHFGEFGQPSLGYNTAVLRDALYNVLHLGRNRPTVWVGARKLQADSTLVGRFAEHNYNIVAVFAADRSRAPKKIEGIEVMPLEDIPRVIGNLKAEYAVIATEPGEAQRAADLLVQGGIRGILNLTSASISAAPHVCVRSLDVVAELFALNYYCEQAGGDK